VATNPLPEISGLKVLIPRLLKLPKEKITQTQREAWRRLLNDLPDVPMKQQGGKRFLLPAETFKNGANFENPELYAVFPYRMYTLLNGSKEELDVAHETWRRRRFKFARGWAQNAIQAAYLGITEDAQKCVVSHCRYPNGCRFLSLWGPTGDWLPDQCHGSVILIALQRMLMQCEGKKIMLLPAWPEEWDVDFKLQAPYETTVEVKVRKGEIVDLKVLPKSRRIDIVFPPTLTNKAG